MDWKNVKIELQKPFDNKDIEWRIQQLRVNNQDKPKAIILAYVTNRAIMERLDDVFGIIGWKNIFRDWHGSSQLCGISVYNDDRNEWITKWDGADNTNFEATKGGLSDSMKRCAVQWGIGRYLYNVKKNYALFSNTGKNYVHHKESGKWFRWDAPNKIIMED